MDTVFTAHFSLELKDDKLFEKLIHEWVKALSLFQAIYM